ncbi:MAG: T9SS type A sorting domain-containing protein, partial [Aureispira sp.]|nr:T9SS type A sorting domain-containing protein [Aureispira sp.]
YFSLFFGHITFSQNLVLNPSFDTFSLCPTGLGQFAKALHWSNPLSLNLSTPDLFHSCSPGITGVPTNFTGYQHPHSGDGYAAIITYLDVINEYREYLQGELSTPLIIGQSYTVSLWVSLANVSRYRAPNLGVYFTGTQIGPNLPNPNPDPNSNSLLPYLPQVKNDSISLIDTVGWQKLEWIYTASGGERFILIGNFNSDSMTNHSLQDSNSLYQAYYCIDDVSVTSVITSLNDLTTVNRFNIYPNPTAGHIFIDLELMKRSEITIQVINVVGEVILSKNLGKVKSKTLEFDLENIPNGVYLVQVKNDNETLSKKVVVSD